MTDDELLDLFRRMLSFVERYTWDALDKYPHLIEGDELDALYNIRF